MTTIRIGTLGDSLSTAQATTVANRLGAAAEVVLIAETGDAAALREALLSDRCDVIVHRLAELPETLGGVPAQHPGLAIAATPKRGDARDALCARDGLTLEKLPPGSKVGAVTPLRRAQLLRDRPDLVPVSTTGTIETDLEAVDRGDLAAVIVALADLDRLGRGEAATERFGIETRPTAPAQGALAIESRAGREQLAARLNHRPTRTIVEAELEVLERLAAGHCTAPVAANAFIDDALLFLSARVYSADGAQQLTSSHALYVADSETPAADAAARVATELLDAGATGLAGLGSTP